MIGEAFDRLLRARGVREALPAPGERARCSALPGAAPAALAAALCRADERLVVVAARDPEAAEEIAADLETLAPGSGARYLPQRETLPWEDADPHVEVSSRRVDALAALLSGRTRLLVTTARALAERSPVGSEGSFSLRLAEGGTVRREELVTRLERMGFEPGPVVRELGEYSVRGGIVDVFPFGVDDPIRIELWGDEIASIRRFDLLTQRSIERAAGVEVLPVALEEGAEDAAAERRALVELLPPDALVIDLDEEDGRRRRRRLWEEVRRGRERAFDRHLSAQGLVVPPEEAEARLRRLRRLAPEPEAGDGAGPGAARGPGSGAENGAGATNAAGATSGAGGATRGGAATGAGGATGTAARDRADRRIELGIEPPPAIDRDMTALAREIRDAAERSEPVLILCDNEGQMERLEEILEEIGGRELARHATPALGSVRGGFRLPPETPLLVLTDHEVFRRSRRLRRGRRYHGTETLESVASLTPGDYVVHMDHGIGVFRGLERVVVGDERIETLKIEYAEGEILRVPHYRLDLVERWTGMAGEEPDARPPAVHKLGGRRWKSLRRRTEASIREMATELLDLYAHRTVADGFAFSPDTRWQREMESAFLYEDTPDQREAWRDVKSDMETPRIMDRLICGDVGYGKTEIAIRAAFKAVQDGKQVAVLAPTTVLVEQHLHTFRERLAGFPVIVEALSRLRTRAEQSDVLQGVREGRVDILVGTHRLLSGDLEFRDLGLLVVDEEQRFGVRHKERLKEMKRSVDVLTLTATPIPRTMQLALGGLRDMSLIETAPRDRMPIITHVLAWSDEILRDAMRRELDRGGQVFFVHDRIETIDVLAARVERLVPDARVAVAHGRVGERKLESVMADLMERRIDVLVSTSIIENGLDVPNANTMIVHRADRFGLAQLYQLRGRVGRSHHRAYCYLLVPSTATPEAVRRLRILEHHTDLGSGYRIALKDLQLRGAGNLLGAEQSGFAQAVGFDTYQRLLEQTVRRLRDGGGEAPAEPPQVSVDGEAYLPDDYVTDGRQKLSLYRRLSQAASPAEVEELRAEIRDRFGPLPDAVDRLLHSVRLERLGRPLGIEWMRVGDRRARVHFREGMVPRLAHLRGALEDRQVTVEVRRTRPLSLVLVRAGVEPLLPTLAEALELLSGARPGARTPPAETE